MPDLVRCPICGHTFPPEAGVPRPFCSERCRSVDLGSWLDGRYRISTSVEEAEDGDAAPAGAEPEKR